MVLAATNFPWDLDEALRRRLEKRVYIPLPARDDIKALLTLTLTLTLILTLTLTRTLTLTLTLTLALTLTIKALLEINLKQVALEEGVSLDALAARMDGYSGADVTSLCRDAAMMPMRRAIKGLNRDEIKNLKKEDTDLPVSQADLEQVLARVNSSVAATDLVRHTEWMNEFGST